MYKEHKFKIEGIAPLIMHNGQLADPLNKWAQEMKKVTSKRKKTEEDFAELARLEWMGGLYLDAKGAPAIPGELIEAMLIGAAKKNRRGTDFKSGIICDGVFPLEYSGPKDVDALIENLAFRDIRGVRIGQNRVMRCRPIFHDWKLTFTVHYLPSIVELGSLTEAVSTAGSIIGIGDYRPRFGRFVVA